MALPQINMCIRLVSNHNMMLLLYQPSYMVINLSSKLFMPFIYNSNVLLTFANIFIWYFPIRIIIRTSIHLSTLYTHDGSFKEYQVKSAQGLMQLSVEKERAINQWWAADQLVQDISPLLWQSQQLWHDVVQNNINSSIFILYHSNLICPWSYYTLMWKASVSWHLFKGVLHLWPSLWLFMFFLKNYNILVTSKVCFLQVIFQGTLLLHWNFTNSSGYWFITQNMENIDFHNFFYCNFTTMVSTEVKLWFLSSLEHFWPDP